MPKMIASQGGPEMDDGTFPATLLGISVEQPTASSPNQKEWLKWVFVVDDGSAEGVELTAASAYKLTLKSKTRAWVEALLGRKLDHQEELDTDTLPPRDCFVMITHDEKGFAKVETVLPVPKTKTGKAAIKAAPPDKATKADEDEDRVTI